MANPTWFDYNFYMAAKLTQMQKTNPSYTPDQLKETFKINGFDGAEGAYNHYIQYGDSEGLSPSMYMDHDVYMTAKLLQMQKTNPKYDMPQLIKDFAGLTAGEHYALYGKKEGLNPSNAFDVDKYMADKLELLIKTDPNGKWTPTTVQEAFDKAGLTALDHFLLYGKTEGLTAQAVDAPIHPHNPGTTTKLTDKVETFIGTAKDDVVNGAYVDLKSDKLVDAYTNDYDTINLTATGNVDNNGATITGFEALNVDYSGVFASNVDVTDFTGLQDLTVKATNASYTGGLTVTGAGTANVIAGAGVKGALVVEGVKSSIITANDDITSVKVAADTAGMTATVKAGAKTATVDLTGTDKKADTATVVLQDNATVKVTTMDGANDSLTLNVAADKTVTLEGDANTVAVKGAGNVTVKGLAADLAGNTVTRGNAGTLTVEVTDAIGDKTDFSAVAADNIVLGAGAAAAATGALFKSGQNIEVKGDIASGATFTTDAATNGSLNLTMKANVAALATAAASSTTSLTNMNIIADVAAVGTAAKGALTITALTVDNALLTGTNDVTVTTATISKFDARGLDGDLKMSVADHTGGVAVLGAKGDNTVTFDNALTKIDYTGSDGVDTVNFGTVATGDKIVATLGKGDDVATLVASNISGTATKVFVDMGEGTKDTLHLSSVFTVTDMTFKGVESVVTDAATTINATTLASLGSFELKASTSAALTVTTTGAETTIDASHVEAVRGAAWVAGELVLKAGDSGTTIIGSANADTIIGGKGDDIMTGGAGADTFNFGDAVTGGSAGDIAAVKASVGTDIITNFVAGDTGDQFVLSNTIFGTLGTAGDKLATAKFVSVASGTTSISDNLSAGGFVYNQADHSIYYTKATGASTPFTVDGLGDNGAKIGVIGSVDGTLTFEDFTISA